MPLPSFIGNVNRAIAVSTRRTSRTIAFVLGLPFGMLIAFAAVYLLGLLIPVTAPMAFMWTVSIIAAVSIAFTRIPALLRVLEMLTREESKIADRAQELYEAIMGPLQREAQQMRSRGVSEAEIEKFLAPARTDALAIYFGELSKIRGAERLAKHLPPAREDKALGPRDPS
ncbi:MAG: hypothetical protein AB1Z98_16340 [Nannocystaceae bacterium]